MEILSTIPLKYVSLVILTIQNSAVIITMHYSRIMNPPDQRYFSSTAVFIAEIMKIIVCIYMALKDQARESLDGRISFRQLYYDVLGPDSWKLTIPAALYTLQNNLQYIAISNLSAASFQVTYQLKILTTALFSVIMLRRTLSVQKWIALVFLTLGVIIVQLNGVNTSTNKIYPDIKSSIKEPITMSKRSPMIQIPHNTDDMDSLVGLVAVIIACILSGIAGVYFEKVLKGSTTSLWIRNVQLSFFSLFPAFFIGVLWKDGEGVLTKGFFYGYNPVVWTATSFQALGGIIVALVVKYADNILKGFATSVSILISFLASVILFDFVVTAQFIIGACIVLASTWLYSQPDTSSYSSIIKPTSIPTHESYALIEDLERDSKKDIGRNL